MEASLIRTVDLCRYYRRGPQEIRAVDRVNAEVKAGDFLAVVGSSGSGKSTLLNLMAGLDRPSGGAIEVDGVSLTAMSRRQLAAYRAHSVGMIFQTFNLIQHRSALENVEMALYFNSVARKSRREKAAAMLERLGLGDRMTHVPSDLSGGEQQRVAIARALVKEPAILFADEPTGNLDEENASYVAGLMRTLNEQGLTVVMVTHDLDIAREYARRIIRMHYGKITEELTPAGGTHDPA